MKTTRSVLFCTLLVAALPAAAGPSLALTKSPQEPHAVLDDLNLLLLYGAKTGQALAPLQLVELTDGRATDDLRQALARYRAAGDARARFEQQSLIEYAVQERQDSLRNAAHYVVPLASTIGAFDAGKLRFPLQLRLETPGREHEPGKQCLQPYRLGGSTLVACLTSASLASNDEIFHYLPVHNAASAALIEQRHRSGRLRMYALAVEAGPYQLHNVQGVQRWTQPVTFTGLLLLDAETSQVLGVAKAQGAAGQGGAAPAPAPVTAPGAGAQVADAGAASGPGANAGLQGPGRLPARPAAPAPVRGNNPAPVTDGPVVDDPSAPAPGELAQETPLPEIDRLLSLLSLAVYSDQRKIDAVQAEIGDIDATIGRIEADPNRNPGVRARELRKLALALEAKQRALAGHENMLALKAGLPASHGLTAVPIERAHRSDKIHMEHYRTVAGHHIIVFRGSDNRHDFETDFQLATTPEMLAELAARLKTGTGPGPGSGMIAGARGSIGNWMQTQADTQVSTNPAAFQLADHLVAALVRGGVKPSNIILAGHSLGGGLAQFAGLRNRVGQIVTFNPAPLSPRQTELLATSSSASGARPTVTRNYIAFVPSPLGGGTFDPVSSALADVTGLRDPRSLRVLGEKRIVTVCNDLESEGYKSFANAAQGIVTKLTLSTMAAGKGALANAATALGAASGGSGAGTDHVSAIGTGARSGRTTGKVLGAGMNCMRHPFLCSAAAAGGGIASVATSVKLPELYSMYSAHSMKRMYESLHEEGPPACHAIRVGMPPLVAGNEI